MRNLNAEKTAELLLAQDNILILTHRNPDGDTLGSAFALLRALRAAGKTAGVLCAAAKIRLYVGRAFRTAF